MSKIDEGTEEINTQPEIKEISFAPGVLEQLEDMMPLDELQEFMNQLGEMMKDGSFLSESTLVDLDELEKTDPEMYAAVVKSLNEVDDVEYTKPTKH
ncbi:MAG: hypothetical protein CTY12_08640 [Methylotenera sp.]|nr:MAG: hypothetical protein CTY12_08640 [Methylotenera sp.]